MTDYTDLIARLRENADLDAAEHVPSGVVQMQYDAADAIEALVKEREQLSTLRKQIEELEPAAWCDVNEISFVSDDFRQNAHSSMAAYHHVPLYTLEGIKE